jgi:sucrose-6-phosphate hydrolase SacC (GH32 family)
MTWGHAISRDLIHWEQQKNALEPDELGTIYSGSAVVDWNNSSGLQSGEEHVLVAFYTSAGAHAPAPRPFTQSMAFSNDRGRSWSKYAGNPIVGHIEGSNRDPKVVWSASAAQWIMGLYLDGHDYALLGSSNLREWTLLSRLTLPGVSECPDLFELAVDGDTQDTRWVFWGANGGYLVGSMDEQTFIPEMDVRRAEQGTNGYAAQTWSAIPVEDGRCVQISWMAGGKYPSMPFNQQMSFPVVLSLRRFEDGIHLCRTPVAEIERLYDRRRVWTDHVIPSGKTLAPDTDHDLFDLSLDCDTVRASGFTMEVRGHKLVYRVPDQTLTCFGKTVTLKPIDGTIKLRLLVDRTSLELLSADGRLSMSCCFLPEAADRPLEIAATDGDLYLRTLDIHELRSIWNA